MTLLELYPIHSILLDSLFYVHYHQHHNLCLYWHTQVPLLTAKKKFNMFIITKNMLVPDVIQDSWSISNFDYVLVTWEIRHFTRTS